MMTTLGVIYGIRYKHDSAIYYVGQTRGRVQERWRGHMKGKTFVSQALRFFGVEQFDMVVLEQAPVDTLNVREGHWIEALNTLAPFGLNCRTGGFVSAMSKNTLTRMAAARKKLWTDPEYHARVRAALQASWTDERKERASKLLKVRMADPETRAKLAGVNVGRKRSAEYCAKMSARKKAEWDEPGRRERQSERQTGRKASAETRAKMSQSAFARDISEETRAAYRDAANRRWARVKAEREGAFA